MKKIMSAALLALAVGGAHAQMYVGGTAGVSNAAVDCDGAISCDKSDSGFKLYAGYSFTPNVAAEVAYLNFGKLASKGYTVLGLTSVEIKNTAVVAALALRGDFTPEFGGSFRIGLASVDTKVDVSATFGRGSDSESNIKAYVGLGLDYAFTKQLKGVLAADFTNGEVGDQKGSVRLFTIGAQYSF